MKKGHVAVVLMENRPELLMVIGALAKIGAIAGLINAGQKNAGLCRSIDLIRDKVFIVGAELLDKFEAVKPELELTDDHILLLVSDNGSRPFYSRYTDLQAQARQLSGENPPIESTVTLQDPFAYVFTSGTTGFPKAAVQIHRRWIGAMYWFGKTVLNLKPGDVHYCTLPLYHTNALVVSWGACAGQGATLALRRKFSTSAFWADCRKFKATSFVYIGEICRYLIHNPLESEYKNHCIAKVIGNGLQPAIWQRFKTRFGIAEVYEFYGAAEVPLVFTNLFNLDGTMGCCLTPFAIVRYDLDTGEPIRSANGQLQRVSPGESGLLLAGVSRDALFTGYTNRFETEKKIVRNAFISGDVWFNTGDVVRNLGWRHAQFADRIGDTFRWKGENVSTCEVEGVINSLDAVFMSAVYGVKIPGIEGQAGMVAIRPANRIAEMDLKALLTMLHKTLPAYGIPLFVRLTEEIQTTDTLKVKKNTFKTQGYDPRRISDPLFILLPDRSEYVPLTRDLFVDIMNRKFRI
jgi:citronellyl-CoA synthetase